MSTSLRPGRVLQIAATLAAVALAVLGAVRSTAGIQGSGLRVFAAIGPITSIGSGTLTVGGVDYSTSGSQVEINGNAGSTAQLHTGDVVSIGGTQSLGNGREKAAAAHAGAVSFSANVRGAVSGIDVQSGTIFVLGQSVHVNGATQLGIQGGGLQALQSGSLIEVSGFADAAGNVVATRVGTPGSDAAPRVVGTIRNLNPIQQTFDINALRVSFGSAEVGGTLAEGATVAVAGAQTAASGTLMASRVDLQSAPQAAPGTEGRIEGLITDFASTAYFEVEGQPVSVFPHASLNLHVPLGLEVEVKVTGVFDGNGVLVAGKVQTKAH